MPTVAHMAPTLHSESPHGLGARIRQAREAAGLYQHQLAEAVEVGPTAVTRWETGKRIPPAVRLSRVAKTLNVTVDYLLGQDAA